MRIALGLGCDRDAPFEVVEQGIIRLLTINDLCLENVSSIASVDLKADETAFLELSEKYGWKFYTYAPIELDVVEGIQNPSEVVKKYIGTRSVAEAAALKSAGASQLLAPKTPFKLEEGGKNMTCAIAAIPE